MNRIELLRHVVYVNGKRLMATVDAGAHLTVVDEVVAARLGITPSSKSETVEMMGGATREAAVASEADIIIDEQICVIEPMIAKL